MWTIPFLWLYPLAILKANKYKHNYTCTLAIFHGKQWQLYYTHCHYLQNWALYHDRTGWIYVFFSVLFVNFLSNATLRVYKYWAKLFDNQIWKKDCCNLILLYEIISYIDLHKYFKQFHPSIMLLLYLKSTILSYDASLCIYFSWHRDVHVIWKAPCVIYILPGLWYYTYKTIPVFNSSIKHCPLEKTNLFKNDKRVDYLHNTKHNEKWLDINIWTWNWWGCFHRSILQCTCAML